MIFLGYNPRKMQNINTLNGVYRKVCDMVCPILDMRRLYIGRWFAIFHTIIEILNELHQFLSYTVLDMITFSIIL